MILSFNVRDSHPKDKKIIEWYRRLSRSDRSREIRKILLSHIEGGQHSIELEVGNSLLVPTNKQTQIKMIDISGGESDIDLDSKLDNLGGVF